VSVSSQRHTEEADLRPETSEFAEDPDGELAGLTAIYEDRGLRPELAVEVATELMLRDALGAHARDELGLPEDRRARPSQAVWASAL
jgi:VIT1/CCC1 family predicted Fe2+/Mn2+ transporter